MTLQRAEIVLPARGRFDLAATVRSHGSAPLAPWRWQAGTRPRLERAEQLPDGSVHLLRIRPAGRGVLLQVTGRDAREIEVLAPLAARVRRALRLDDDLARFHTICARDATLRPVARLGLGRVLRGTTVFEDVVTVLASISGTPAGTSRSLTALAALGRPCPGATGLRAFPSPARLCRLPLRRIRLTGLGVRGLWVRAIACGVAAKRVDLETLDRLSPAEARPRLGALPGLGPVGVSRMLLLLGHADEPPFDRETRARVRQALGRDGDALDRWLERQRPWRGLAVWFAGWTAANGPAALLRTPRPAARPGRRASRS